MKILFVNPSKWGRGITPIWIPAHTAVLKSAGHEVALWDGTFFSSWTDDELNKNTETKQFKKSDYSDLVVFTDDDPVQSLQVKINAFDPDIIFWSAVSSMIHGEGEYVSIQYGYDLVSKCNTTATLVAGGLQVMAEPEKTWSRFPKIDLLITGESDLVLNELAVCLESGGNASQLKGLVWRNDAGEIVVNPRQPIISNLGEIPHYDYGLFDDQVFLRPYNGDVLRAADYELSRGCVYTCAYCVETVIQKYYGFTERTAQGTLRQATSYVRAKDPQRIFEEFRYFEEELKLGMLRCQDTNFLTIPKDVLRTLVAMVKDKRHQFHLYVECRPDNINERNIDILKELNVDGVGMGIELAESGIREESLNRFSDQEKIIRTFKLLRDAGIKRTTYNVIGFPGQKEESIINTIVFNKLLDPDNMTVAYYSPFIGTDLEIAGREMGMFDDYEHDVDGQIRSNSKNQDLPIERLAYYKENFVDLVREG